MAVVFVLGLLAAGITEKRAEIAYVAKTAVGSGSPIFIKSNEPSLEHDKMKVSLAKTDPPIDGRNDQWGKEYQRQYETWKKTKETDFTSKFLGNNIEDGLEVRPNMVVIWAGYAFSRDYFAPRGHWYTLHDMRKSLRTGSPGVPGPDGKPMPDMQFGNCWTCKSPDVPRMMQQMGVGAYYSSKWSELGHEVVNPLGCANCHDPKTMQLAIATPALVEAFKRMDARPEVKAKAAQYISFGGDVTKASANELRSLVCAQCHVEYYFAEITPEVKNRYATFPWDYGFTMEDMEKYYDQSFFYVNTPIDGQESNVPYRDWTHAVSRAPMLKAQHPDWEIHILGTHGKRGVSCADCHMPYKVEGGIKYTDHQIMSPLKNIAGTCQTCHRDSEEKLRGYVEDHQAKLLEMRNRTEEELTRAHLMVEVLVNADPDVAAAIAAGKNHRTVAMTAATKAELAKVHQLIREAGWRWDYGVASHGASFHAPVETARILMAGLDKALLAQIEAQRLLTAKGLTFALPDIDTKAKAQKYIGLNMEQLEADKAKFMADIVPGWIEKARANNTLTEPSLLDEYKGYDYFTERKKAAELSLEIKKTHGPGPIRPR
jgi:nitrite reductase (cytochrome c-552)